MRITENRRIAWVALALCVLIAVFGLGGAKLRGKYGDVKDYFLQGTDSSHSMEAYLGRCVRYANDLAYESRRYLEDEALSDNVLALSGKLDSVSGVSRERSESYRDLTDAVESLYSELQKAGASDETAVRQAYQDYRSAVDLIRRDDYTEKAAAYHDIVSGFPANVIAKVWGISQTPRFGN